MTDERRIQLNKLLRSYTGKNPFILSLRSQLKSNKYLSKIEVGKKTLKILSDKQYAALERVCEGDILSET